MVIPTYEVGINLRKNPIFLEKRVYQGFERRWFIHIP